MFQYYPIDAFKLHLLNPEQFSKSEMVFQDTVASLLSLTGQSVINLGKKEYRKFGEKKQNKAKLYDSIDMGEYHFASIDLIAYRENEKLFLVDCTIGIVDDSKIKWLKQTVLHFASKEELNWGKVVGLIISPRDCSDTKQEGAISDINIVDKKGLEIILSLIEKQEFEEARKRLLF